MAENTQLAAFLDEGRPPGAEPQAPPPEPQPNPIPEPKPDKPEPKPDAVEADDAPPPAPLEGEDVVAFRAFQDERKKRQDWKERAIRNEERAAALERDLEAAKRAAAQPPPQQQYQQPPPEIPNPAHDPQGYHAYVMQEQQRAQINHMLNVSEMHALREHGAEAVAAMKREFLAATDQDPTLGERLIQQADPYGWAMQQIEAIRARREIGDNPAAYRARIEAEARAKWEAEAQQQQRGPGVPTMQPSLATARSVASRSAPAWTGEPSLEDLVSSIQNRKKRG
jgi:hypothetical protein